MPERRAAVAGVGYTAFSKESGRPVLDLAADAVLAACDDAVLDPDRVDGLASHMVGADSENCQAVATALGLPGLRHVVDLTTAGQAPCHLVGLAASAVITGQADAVVVFRALNGRSGPKVGSARFPGRGGQYRYPVGYGAYPMYIATWAQRYLHETGQTGDDLGSVAVAQRRYAVANERAILREPLDLEGYRNSPWVTDPFRVADCTECHGVLKPDIVYFGESVPSERVRRGHELIESADLVLAVGTSLTVQSGFRFVRHARSIGREVAVVNRGRTRAHDVATLTIDGDCVEVLAAVDAALG